MFLQNKKYNFQFCKFTVIVDSFTKLKISYFIFRFKAMSECIICFSTQDDSFVRCKCNTCVCDPCMQEYMGHCKKEINKIATCPYCNAIFEYESFAYSRILESYVEDFYVYIRKEPTFNNQINTIINNVAIIRRMKEDRLNFMNSLPNAISVCIRIALKDKYDSVMKVNIDNIPVSQNIKCFNGICPNGKLTLMEDEYICDSCENHFCVRCHKIILMNHVCKREDLDSAAYLENLVHCPTCNVPTEKISGCDYVTCSMCKTKFNYATGQESDYGGPRNSQIVNNNVYTLSQEIKNKYSSDIFNCISDYEKKKPPPFFGTDELNYFLIQENLDINGKIRLLFIYSKYVEHRNYLRQHSTKLLEIRQLHIDGKLTLENINQILK